VGFTLLVWSSGYAFMWAIPSVPMLYVFAFSKGSLYHGIGVYLRCFVSCFSDQAHTGFSLLPSSEFALKQVTVFLGDLQPRLQLSRVSCPGITFEATVSGP
jgi:hypothetical protein